tara:strand:- start:64537 stop:64911 length:375 start_codon:yes stop_codon:yes gene_type:complete
MEIEVSEDGFINVIRCISGGALVEELDREMIKGVQAIFDHGGKSEITLKIKIDRVANLETAVNISHDVTAKHPKEARGKKAMFITKGSGLSDQYQEQGGLPLGTPTEAKRPNLSPVSHFKGDSA